MYTSLNKYCSHLKRRCYIQHLHKFNENPVFSVFNDNMNNFDSYLFYGRRLHCIKYSFILNIMISLVKARQIHEIIP
jgi:hypothetical protein